MHSFFALSRAGDTFSFTPEDEKHLSRVLRLREGAEIAVIWDDSRYLARVAKDCRADVVARLPSTEPKTRITLYQGVTKGDRMDYTVQKCAETGVCRVVPVLMARCVAQGGKPERWRRVALEAAKQAQRTRMPEVADPVSFGDMCRMLKTHEQALVPWEEAGHTGLKQAYRGARDIAVIIGPEGGITPEEIEKMPAEPVTLGPRIFRTETAGPVACACLLLLAGDME